MVVFDVVVFFDVEELEGVDVFLGVVDDVDEDGAGVGNGITL